MMANLVAALDSGHSRPQIDIQPTSVIEVLEEAAAAAAALTEGKPRSVTLILPKRSALAMIDRAMVVRALTNLLFTAVSKTTQDARVTVGTTELAGWWQISVSDENRGAPWWRSDCAGLSGTDGPPPPAEESDLGLAITRAIVRSHGGTIGLTSSPDKGNTFWFTLPAAVSLESKGANEAQQTST